MFVRDYPSVTVYASDDRNDDDDDDDIDDVKAAATSVLCVSDSVV